MKLLQRRATIFDEDGEVISLDLLLVTSHVEDVWDSKITLEWDGKNLSVVSIDGLIKMKELAGREKDLIDIRRLKREDD